MTTVTEMIQRANDAAQLTAPHRWRGQRARPASLTAIKQAVRGLRPRVYASMTIARGYDGADFGPLGCARFEAGCAYNGSVALSVAYQPIADEWMASVRGELD